MNRTRRPAPKPFVSGGVLDPAQAAQPAVAATPPAAPRNYSYQNTPKRVNPTPQAQPQAVKTPQPAATPVKKPFPEPIIVLPEVKPEPISINLDESVPMENNEEVDGSPEQVGGKLMFKKIFAFRKKSSVRTKEKKILQNRKLRKIILPKNALMALNEVKGINIGDFVITSNVGGGFTAVVTVNDKQYEGKGPSKVFAKNNACEKALRDYVLDKIRQHPRRRNRPSSISGDTPMDTSESNNTSGENGADFNGGNKPPLQDEGDVPMINLTSFALYKLFTEWENEGFEIPEFHHNSNTSQTSSDADSTKEVKEPKKPTIRTELPANWETMHPATLLCMMRPGLTYIDYGVVGEKPNTIQSLGVIVDEKEFVGKGRSKKVARRNASVNVCNTLFGTNFELEEPAVTAPAAS